MTIILQLPGLLGGPEVLILMLILLVFGFFLGRWVYRDAKSRGSSWAWQWGVAIGIFLVPVVPSLVLLALYLLLRGPKISD